MASTVLRLSWVDESSVVNGKISITLEHAAGCNVLQALAWLGQSVESLTVERKVTDSIPGREGVKQDGCILSDAHYFFYKIFSLTVL